MYWRVQKISVEQLAKSYAVYVVCILSVFFNLFLFSKFGSLSKLTVQQRVDYESFAKEVTRHICDSCFVTYSDSMYKLAFTKTKPELGSAVIKALTPDLIPPTVYEMKAIDKRLHETKSVSQVAIDDVKVEEVNSGGLVPVEVGGRVVRSSAGEVTGPESFRFKFFIGTAKNKDTKEEWTVVADMRDITGQSASPTPVQ
jgi:hypothetical protein